MNIFGQAVLLGVLIFAVVEGLKRIVPTIQDRVLVPLVFAVGIGAVALIAHSAWAPNEVIEGVALSKMNFASQAVAGLLAGAAAVGINETFNAVRNIGSNQ